MYLYLLFAQIIIQTVQLYIIQLYFKIFGRNSHQEQLEMDTEICRLRYSEENMQLLFVCKAHAVQEPFVNEKKAIVNIIYFIAVLFVLYWRD
jgi:hypothetical protein